jgi:hypothetical protein
MSSQERVCTAIARHVPERVPIQDEPWAATVRRWEGKGLPLGKIPADHFGYDFIGISADLSPRFPERVLEENGEFVVETTAEGGVRRNPWDRSTMLEVIECLIKRPENWPATRERLRPDMKRMNWASTWSTYQTARGQGRSVTFHAACGYDLLQSYVRSKQLLGFMAIESGFVKAMVDFTSDLALASLQMMWREGFRFDCLQPLEVKAGMDLRELKPSYGDRIAFFGGINTMLMEEEDDELIEEEIRFELASAQPGGRYLCHSDHSIPKDVSLRKYSFVMDCVRRYGSY